MKKFLSGILSLVIALFLLEIVSRTAYTFVADAESDKQKAAWHIYSRELGWERKPRLAGRAVTTFRSFDENGFLAGDSAKLLDATKKKILFVGDSNMFGTTFPSSNRFRGSLIV